MLKRLSILVCAFALSSCITEPTDSLEYGQLCLPSTGDCPSTTTLSRDAVGRNQLDYTVENLGSAEAAVRAIARIPRSEVADGGDDGLVASDEEGIIVERTHRVPPGESTGNRWTPQNLGTRESFDFEIQCVDCEVGIDYVLMSVPLECIQDSDCSSGWFCDTAIPGRCVECRADSECDVDEQCDEDRGRCTPPKDAGGCSTAGDGAGLLGLFALLFSLLMLGGRRIRRFVVLAAAVALPYLQQNSAWAEPPVASLSVGAGARSLTGDVGSASEVGVGLFISQELRWKYIGEAMRLDTAYFLTAPETPPFSNDFRTITLTIGPRGYLPIGDWQIIAGPDYVRFGVASNSLIRITGEETGFNGVGGVVGGRFQWSGLEGRAEVGYQHIFGFPGGVITVDLAFAISTAF